MEYMLILVYARFGIDVFGPYTESINDAKIVCIIDSRDEQPEAVYRLTVANGVKSVIEYKET